MKQNLIGELVYDMFNGHYGMILDKSVFENGETQYHTVWFLGDGVIHNEYVIEQYALLDRRMFLRKLAGQNLLD